MDINEYNKRAEWIMNRVDGGFSKLSFTLNIIRIIIIRLHGFRMYKLH